MDHSQPRTRGVPTTGTLTKHFGLLQEKLEVDPRQRTPAEARRLERVWTWWRREARRALNYPEANADLAADAKARAVAEASAAPHTPAPDAPTPLPQVEALRRQQQRILHRSALVDYVLAAETLGGGPLTMGDALAELLADITEAARTIGTLLQTTTGRS